MFINFFKSAIRSFRKNILYASINVTGLAIAIALSILIFLFINDELTYDTFHRDKDKIYRIEAKQYAYGESKNSFPTDKDGSFRWAWMPTPFGPAIKEEIPDIVEFTRFTDDEGIFAYNDKVFNEKLMFVDPGFLSMFDFELISGSRNTALNDVHDLLITPAVAKKYFNDENPVGKTVQLNIWGKKTDCIISGIIKEAPGNSSLNFKILVRQELRGWYKESLEEWGSYNTPTFVKLGENSDIKQFRQKLDKFADKYFGKFRQDERARQKLADNVKIFELAANPLVRIHLDKNVSFYGVSDITYSYILGGIGLLILFIACINYISLSVSSAAGRSTEIGIRKVLGAGKGSLARHFWGESQVLVVISMGLGLLLAALFLDPFNQYTGKTLSLFTSSNLWFLLFLFLATFLIGLLAGGYPAFFLSGFQPVEVLKRKRSGKYNLSLTRGLVILQYALSAILITSSLVMFRQMKYITTKDLGYSNDQVLVVPTYTGYSDDGERLVNNLKNELRSIPDVISVSGTSFSFNRGGWSKNGFQIDGKEHFAYIYRVDPDYSKTLGLQIIAGRDFNSQSAYDMKHAILVNEALVKDYGWENPVGQHLNWRSDTVADEIVGIVKDYHFLAFTEKIQPAILALSPNVSKVMMAMIKINHKDIPGTMNTIEKVWKSQNPDKPFDYSFLDEDVARQYAGYQRWMKIMGYSTGLAIFIACLGLFGLAGISASNRTKEISIRKVFGAGISNLFILLNREIVLLAIVSFIIATPVSWYFMNKWLDTFIYRIGIPWIIFVIAALAGTLVAVATVSYHSIRTALVNPAEILKDE